MPASPDNGSPEARYEPACADASSPGVASRPTVRAVRDVAKPYLGLAPARGSGVCGSGVGEGAVVAVGASVGGAVGATVAGGEVGSAGAASAEAAGVGVAHALSNSVKARNRLRVKSRRMVVSIAL